MKQIKLLTLLAALVCTVSMNAQIDAPLTFEAMTAGATVTYTLNGSKPLQYSTDGINWNDYSSAITLANVGDKVSFRGNNTSYYNYSSSAKFQCSNDCYIYGNIMSLVDAENYATATTLASANAFNSMFWNNTHIKFHTSKDFVLPATTLASDCYKYMFRGCSGITSIPGNLLPAKTLASGCYQGMFQGTGITSIPEGLLPATTLANYCYTQMFYSCTNLTNAPALPAMSLANYCYQAMFYQCSSLETAPELPATTLATSCYSNMFLQCTSLTESPVLPAAYLPNGAYTNMFGYCTNLNKITCMATSWATSGVSSGWLYGTSSTGTFYAPFNTIFTSMPRSISHIPDGWTIAVALRANEDSQNAGVYYSTLFDGTQRYKLPNDGTEAYVAAISGDALVLTKIAEVDDVLPENTAVILKSPSPVVALMPTDDAAVTFSATNSLLGTDASNDETPANCYVLSGHSTDNSVQGVGFYQYSGTYLGAHKAYIIYGASGAPKRMRFVFDEENTATAVENANVENKSMKVIENGQFYIIRDGMRYNAQGQLVK